MQQVSAAALSGLNRLPSRNGQEEEGGQEEDGAQEAQSREEEKEVTSFPKSPEGGFSLFFRK
ncbi:MAG TPA: hypothetical protein VD862_02460 [Candidatus Paceibacterota bacterium]|nr:hypothetical protein [Candidatus Paceibacterota bacterium]